MELDGLVSAVRLPPGVTLDLGGIGKGFAADLVSTELLGAGIRGVRGVLVNLGGDLRARGRARRVPHGWVVEVDDPLGTGRTGLLALGERRDRDEHARCAGRGSRDGRRAAPPHRPAHRRARASRGWRRSRSSRAEAWRAEVLAKAAFVAGRRRRARASSSDAGATGLLVTDDGEVVELAGLDGFRPESEPSLGGARRTARGAYR